MTLSGGTRATGAVIFVRNSLRGPTSKPDGLPGGKFTFLGRRDHQLKVLGKRINLVQISAALSVCPALEEVVVVDVRTPSLSSISASPHHSPFLLIALLVAKAGEKEGEDLEREVAQFARQRLADYERPFYFAQVKRLPRTATGKVLFLLLNIIILSLTLDRYVGIPPPRSGVPGKPPLLDLLFLCLWSRYALPRPDHCRRGPWPVSS